MEYTREQIIDALEGFEPEDIAVIFEEQIITLLQEDPDYFAGNRKNSILYTLEMIKKAIKAGK